MIQYFIIQLLFYAKIVFVVVESIVNIWNVDGADLT